MGVLVGWGGGGVGLGWWGGGGGGGWGGGDVLVRKSLGWWESLEQKLSNNLKERRGKQGIMKQS